MSLEQVAGGARAENACRGKIKIVSSSSILLALHTPPLANLRVSRRTFPLHVTCMVKYQISSNKCATLILSQQNRKVNFRTVGW